MPPQPPWQPVGPLRYFPVQPHSRHTTKVPRCMWRGRPARVLEWSNHSQINSAHIFCTNTARTAAEFSPSLQRIPHPPQSQRPRKVISTTRRHHQYRQPQPHQLPQVPMNRPIATKHQHHIGDVARRRQTHCPLDALLRLEWSQLLRRTSQPENGRRAHVAGRE